MFELLTRADIVGAFVVATHQGPAPIMSRPHPEICVVGDDRGYRLRQVAGAHRMMTRSKESTSQVYDHSSLSSERMRLIM